MDKTKPNEALSSRPIGKKIVAKMKRHRRGKVIDIKDWIDGRTTAEELHKEIVAQKANRLIITPEALIMPNTRRILPTSPIFSAFRSEGQARQSGHLSSQIAHAYKTPVASFRYVPLPFSLTTEAMALPS